MRSTWNAFPAVPLRGTLFRGGGKNLNYDSDSSSDSGSDDEETLRAKLNAVLQHVPGGGGQAGTPRKIQFRYETSPERTRENDEPELKPISFDADRLIPSIGQQAGHVPLMSDSLLEMLTELAAKAAQQQDPEASKDAFLEATAARHLEERKKIKENMTSAKEHWAQLAFGLAGAATFATVALPALVGAPTASLATVGIASNMLNSVFKLFNIGTSLATNPQRMPALRELISKIVSPFRKGFKWLGGGASASSSREPQFSGKKSHPIHFGAGGYAQLQRSAKKEMTSEQLRTDCLQAGDVLLKDLEKARSSGEVVGAAQAMQKTVLNSTQEWILQHGTSAQKETIRHIRNFTKDHEALMKATPEHAKTYRDLPAPTQDHLRQMIFDYLRCPVAELEAWGQARAKAVGMSDADIQRVKNWRTSTSGGHR